MEPALSCAPASCGSTLGLRVPGPAAISADSDEGAAA